jgi:glc operon protein GlcG
LRPEPTHSVELGHCTALDGLVDRQHPSLDLALELLARVRAEADASSLALAMCVVDASGHTIASQRMDGAPLGAMRLAIGKAYTAVLWGARTGDFMESTQPGGADWGWNATDERIVVYAGGLPLFADGALAGGVGASGGTAEQDEACVSAAVRALGFTVEP